MTGHGESRLQEQGLIVAVELRTINSRFIKVSIRSSEGYNPLEPQIEGLLRNKIRRGTIQANVRIERERPLEDYQVNAAVLDRYRQQLDALHRRWNVPGSVSLESLLLLPGVVNSDAKVGADVADDWPVIARALDAAVANLDKMRTDEGQAMANDMRANCQVIAGCLQQIKERAPLVIEAYRKRLEERVSKVLEEYRVSLQPCDLVREVSLFAERSDISEEVVRLGSHLEQFDAIMELPESSGRKLEFLIQEMFRETNTIGSKSYDVEIARLVIDIKTAIERLREMIQNVE
jgi:uncharacterized protein (TIGR00255 family)